MRLAFLFCCLQQSWAFSSSDLFGFITGFGGDDHNKLTTAATSNVANSYPDIEMYQSTIIKESSDEGIGHLGSHKSPDNLTQYWSGNEKLWEEDALAQYLLLDFNAAYQRVGWAVHIIEDAQVPAHQKIVFHGIPGTYVLSPQNSGIASSGVLHGDQFELFASNNHVDTIPPDINFDQLFLDPKTNCQAKFWLSNAEDDDPNDNLGAYGRTDSTCETPSAFDGIDWFADPNYASLVSVGLRIAHGQLYNARVAAESELALISKSFPPLIYDLKTSNSIVSKTVPLSFGFQILENRTPHVTYTIRLLNSDGSFIANIREDVPVILPENGTQVPYQATISGLQWDGTINGQFQPDGAYMLDIRITDDIGNTTPDDVNTDSIAENDTLVSFTIDANQPTQTFSDSNGTVAAGSAVNTNSITVVAKSGPSGLSDMYLDSDILPAAINPQPLTKDSTTQWAGVYGNLAEGTYTSTVQDKNNLEDSESFTIDRTAPTLSYYDADGFSFDPSQPQDTSGVSIVAIDSLSGIDSVTVNGQSGNCAGDLNSQNCSFPNLNDGTYAVKSCDKAGNCTSGSFIIQTDPCDVPTSQACRDDCDKDPNGDSCQTGCEIDPNSAACQDACKESPNGNTCQAACDQDANSVACQDACLADPNGPICDQACKDDPDSDACDDSCTKDPDSVACQDACQQNPNSQACQDACAIDPTSAACQNTCQTDPTLPQCQEGCTEDPSLPWCSCTGANARRHPRRLPGGRRIARLRWKRMFYRARSATARSAWNCVLADARGVP